jgi:peptidoglycan/LPS O-acetylase OafA/YrhL
MCAHLPALTGLRFILAVWVILHHITGKGRMLDPWTAGIPEPLHNLVASGYFAVGTFFVLSGFVLARGYASTSWDRPSLVRYGAARIARVYPVYLLSLLILAPIIYDHIRLNEGGVAPEHRTSLLVNYGLVLQGWSGTLPVHWNTPAWSLSCELFFYLCFPLLLLPIKNAGRGRLGAATVAAFTLPFVFRWMAIPPEWKPILHVSDFLIGIACSSVFDRLGAGRLVGRGYWLYLPAAAFGAAVIAWPTLLSGAVTPGMALRPLNALLLLGLALGGGVPARLLSTPIAALLGKASYSMYILHIPILWWFKRTIFYQTTGSAAVYLTAVMIASTIVFKHFEEPANNRLRRALVGLVLRASNSRPVPVSQVAGL